MEITEEQRQVLENKRKMIRSAPIFEPSRTTWRDWEQAWNDFAVTSGIGLLGQEGQPAAYIEFVKALICTCMRGSAVPRIRPFSTKTPAFQAATSAEAFLTIIKNVFQPPQESESLKQEFEMFKQKADMDVSTYLSQKISLYESAYAADRQDHRTLLTAVIDGLYCNVAKRKLREANPEDKEEMRNKLFEIVTCLREAYVKGYGEATSLDGLQAVTQQAKVITGGNFANRNLPPVEDMEVDEVRERVQKFDQKTGGVKKKETRSCYICKKVGHLAKNCREKKKTNPNIRCYHCGEKGHLIKQCPTRKEDKKEGRMRRKKVNAVNDTKEESEDDTSSEEEVNFLC